MGGLKDSPFPAKINGDVAQLGEHFACTEGVVGSNPIISTRDEPAYLGSSSISQTNKQNASVTPGSLRTRDVVQFGRTLALGARGRWFKSSHLDNN